MSSHEENLVFALEIDAGLSYSELRKLETAASRLLGIFRRMGLSEEIDDAIAKLQRMITTARILQSALVALEIAQAGAGPIGWISAIIGGISAGVAVADTVNFTLGGT